MKKRLLILLSLVAFGFAAMAQDTIRLFTFNSEDAATITLGTLSAGDIVNGETITTDNAHSVGGRGWNRYNDSASFFANGINVYTRSGQWYTANAEYFGGNYLGTDDGFMLMAMMEVTGTYPMNAYIQLPAVNTPEGTQVVAVQMTQLYRKFNFDQCWIDYKVGNDWKSREINVKGVDVNSNSWASFKPYITMPFELAQQPSIELRVRWACNNNAGNAYGYFWMVDNLAIVSAPATNWQRSGNNVYVDGLYGTVPQGWQIPLTWYANVRNIGVTDINGITANIYSQPLEGGVATSVASTTLATLAGNNLDATERIVVDGRQLYDASLTYPSQFYSASGYANPDATITNNGLTTTTDGWYRAYATISSTVGDLEYSSHAYRVDGTDDMGYNRWSLSRGILSSADVGYRHGRSYNVNYVAEEDSRWSITGYGIMTRLTTPNTIPTDEAGEPWVLRGVELVAAPNLNAEGATLKSMLFKADASGNITGIATAIATHVVTADELNNFSSGVKMPGEYNTIRINFPNPVELEPATSYFVGFQKEDDIEFAVARDYNGYYNAAGDQVSFYDDETLVDYADRVPVGNFGVYVFIPGSAGLWAGYTYNEAPMISAVVGPMPVIPTYNISVSHNGGNVIDGISGLGVLSSQPLQYGEGSSVPLYFLSYDNVDNASADDVAEDAMQLKQLIINGEEINLDENYYGDEYTLERYVGDGTNYSYYHTLTFTQLSSDMTVEAVFGPYEAPCLPVANHWVSSVSDTSATIAWEAPEGYTGVYYFVYNGNVIDSVEDVSYTMTGLTSSTTYSGIQIAYRCANGEMKYSSDITFTTNEHQNTFTVTKNGNGYLYVNSLSNEQNGVDGSFVQGAVTTTLMIGGGDVLIFQTASFDPNRLSEIFGENDPISLGMMTADALTVQSIYLDGQMIDISNTSYDEYSDEWYVTYADNYTLQLLDGMAQYGYNMYAVLVNSDGDHELIFNYGAGETPESYTVSFSSNDPTLGEVLSNKENGTYSEGTQLEAYALPQGGVTFVGWAKDSESNIISQTNPLTTTLDTNMNIIGVFTTADIVTVQVHDTLYLTSTDTVYLYNTDTVYVPQVVTDTIYLTDTIYQGGTDTVYVYDTVYVGVDGVETDAAVKLYSKDNQIVVEGAQGADVVLYDAVGRRLAVRRDDFGAVRFEVPATGTYLVRVGQYPARRVVVVK